MAETPEMIQFALDTAGEELVFLNGSIKAILGVAVYAIQNFVSPFDMEKQVYTFTTSITYVQDFVIEEGQEFTLTLGTRVYIFTVGSIKEREPCWAHINANFISVVG